MLLPIVILKYILLTWGGWVGGGLDLGEREEGMMMIWTSLAPGVCP